MGSTSPLLPQLLKLFQDDKLCFLIPSALDCCIREEATCDNLLGGFCLLRFSILPGVGFGSVLEGGSPLMDMLECLSSFYLSSI